MGNTGSSTKIVQVGLLGLDAAGKTTMLYELCRQHGGEVTTEIPTIGLNVESLLLG